MKRTEFLKSGVAGLSAICLTPMTLKAQQEKVAGLSAETIKEFVTAGHSDLTKVKEMLIIEPNLIHSRYDWGGGDFEEAIEGAGHLGNKEIANYLIEKGARVNLFVLTMLGKTELVTPILDAYPKLIHSLGAHGFTLLHHARVGKAEELERYLKKNGLIETHVKIK